jgi:hypothetical protein
MKNHMCYLREVVRKLYTRQQIIDGGCQLFFSTLTPFSLGTKGREFGKQDK